MFDCVTDRTDGYLRIDTQRHRPSRNLQPQYPSANGLLFVDIEGDCTERDVAAAMQRTAIPSVRYILFRSMDPDRTRTFEWLQRLSDEQVLAGGRAPNVAAVCFPIGEAPEIVWLDPDDSIDVDELLTRAMRAEIRSLLEWGHAIWKPTSYHYELPSGDHAASFIRAGDMFRTPRDVEAVATWLYCDLCDRIALLTESASLVPLMVELRRVIEASRLKLIGTATFDEYPRTDFELSQVVHDFDVPDRILAVVSVSASGRYIDTIRRALKGVANPSRLVVMVDKLALPERCGLRSNDTNDEDGLLTRRWIGLALPGRSAPRGQECENCKDANTAQVVAIDPRSFEAMALPGNNLVMPAYVAAKEMSSFFELCDKFDAIDFRASSTAPVRVDSKSKMPIKFELEQLVGQSEFQDAVIRRIERRRGSLGASPAGTNVECENCTKRVVSPESGVLLGEYDSIVVLDYEASYPGFDTLIEGVRSTLTVDPAVPLLRVHVTPSGVDRLPGEIRDSRRPLIVVLGTMTGWTLRQILVSIEDEWNRVSAKRGREISALVIHSVSRTKREYENTCQSFGGRLHSVWQMFLPSRWPLEDEIDFFTTRSNPADLSLQEVSHDRRAVVSERQLNRCVLLGPFEDVRVRNDSLYGTRIGSLTTLVAVGAAMHSARQVARSSDPRWPSFDFTSIARSYYDGLLVASMLRWCDPGEVYWGTTHDDQRRNIEELLARFTLDEDIRILYPELLLACVQGKLHSSCVPTVAATVADRCRSLSDTRERNLLVALLRLVRDSNLEVGDAEAILT